MKYFGILCVFAFNAYTSEDGLYNNKYTHLNIQPYSTQLNEQQENSADKNYLPPKKNEYNTLEEANCHPQNDILPYMIFPKYIDKE